MAIDDAERLGLSQGDEVEVSVNGTSLRAAVALHERMQPGAVFLIEGTADANANALRNGGGETVDPQAGAGRRGATRRRTPCATAAARRWS